MFGRKTYLNANKDGPETLKVEGTKILCCINKIKKNRKGVTITASPTDGPYVDRVWETTVNEVPAGVYVGGYCSVYLDEKDADGDYYMEVGNL